MIKVISIFLAGLISFQSLHISLDDILSLGNLMEHAQYHEQEYGDDLLSFFTKHYGSQQASHMDGSHRDKHGDLPFQHAISHLHCPVAVIIFLEFSLGVPEIYVLPQDSFHHFFHNDLFVIKTFQPPRTV
jgi:hypothetical protein